MSITNSPKDTAILSTAYPGLGRYFLDYLDSLEAQSCCEFDLLIANDGLDGLDELLSVRKISWYSIEVDGSVSSNRRSLIRRAIKMGYRKIIFADCDDTFEKNRIKIVSSMLDSDCIVVNDMDIMDADGGEEEARYFSQRFDENEMITINSLRAGNMIGLTNSAVRTEVLKECPALTSGESEAFDWYLWSSILLRGIKARFTSETLSKYRIYSRNTAGLPQQINEENLVKGVAVKRKHYELMSLLNEEYSELADEFQWLSGKIKDKNWGIQFLKVLEEHKIKHHLWWENIRAPSEVGFK